MAHDNRQELRATTEELGAWVDTAKALLAYRTEANKSGDTAAAQLRRDLIALSHAGGTAWRVILLHSEDDRLLTDVARQAHLSELSAAEQEVFDGLTSGVAAALHDVKPLFGARRLFSRNKQRVAGAHAAQFLNDYRRWALASGVPQLLQHHTAQQRASAGIQVSAAEALTDSVGFTHRIKDLGSSRQLLPASTVSGLPEACSALASYGRDEDRLRSEVLLCGDAVRRAEVRRLLNDMPVERLKDTTRDRLRVSPLREAGIATVEDVLEYGSLLEQVPGIGSVSATRMRGAAQTLWQTTYDDMPVRIDIKNRNVEATELLRSLSSWDAMRRSAPSQAERELTRAMQPLARSLDSTVTHLVVLSEARPEQEFLTAVQVIRSCAARITEANGLSTQSRDPWDDFLSRPADYFALLAELGFLTEDDEKTRGDLPEEIVEAVRKTELDTKHLTASLRGYQSFGARFALVQRKVIIGDEMGLGKTVEALAVLAHLHAKGSRHAIVVCPAAVVTNWTREIGSKSTLRPHRIHGPGRPAATRNFLRNGGVAVTTFETLAWLEPHLLDLDELACVVVDEAHYIKNPEAKRSQRTATMIGLADRAMLLTGTPLESRISEFENLVGYLRPDLVVDATELTPRRFRRQVAPAYLRRNQEDVLTELPELVEVDEWLPLSKQDAAAYRTAVADGNFMAMRQSAMTDGSTSVKMERLREIVEEAEDNGRRVIVFSHFRHVLNEVVRALPGNVFGPLTGSVPAAARQVMVDQFSQAAEGAVLVSQIVAGGVGLNIQAASVVVICEPQLKPTTEWQAIARARRMGQLETVQVHRLLSEVGVDQRITEILARKRELFDEFARISETAESAPEAFDVSEADLAREVIAAERERLFSQPAGSTEEAV